jgi:hypothetical protein
MLTGDDNPWADLRADLRVLRRPAPNQRIDDSYDDRSKVARVSVRLDSYRLAPRAIKPTGNRRVAFEGVTGLTSKGAARSALGGLDATSAQLTAANRAIGRATSSSAINVGMYGERVVVQITRPGANGYQLIETVVARDGSRTVVQMAYDSAGRFVHYDPKFP